MAQVTVTIGGRPWRMACADGEERHLDTLAAEVDARLAEMRAHFGEIGDQRLMIMTAVVLADELTASRQAIARLEAEQRTALTGQSIAANAHDENMDALIGALDEITGRIDHITGLLNHGEAGADTSEQ
jgi:cell division protein ZapA